MTIVAVTATTAASADTTLIRAALGACAPASVPATHALVAVATGDRAALDEALAAAADPATCDAKGVPLLQLAQQRRDRALFTLLLDRGASPAQAADFDGRTAVHRAIHDADPWWLDTLIARKADLNAPNARTGLRPLMEAIQSQNDVALDQLLRAGADPNATDLSGETALHVAAHTNRAAYTLKMLEAGADPLARNKAGATFQNYQWMTRERLLSERARRERDELRAWLAAHGIEVKSPNVR